MIEILSLESERILEPDLIRRPADDLLRLAPRLVLGAPGDVARFVGDFLRRSQVVAVIEAEPVERGGFERV
jgi:hypothetical protein